MRAVRFCLLGLVLVLGPAAPCPAAGGPEALTNVVFLHHSTGANLIAEGNVRPLLAGMGYLFWDHGYNGDGLTDPDGNPAGYNYGIPDDNTNPDGLADIFSQPLNPDPPAPQPPANAFSGLMRHEIIAFKSCFPASAISDDAMLEQYKTWYLTIRDTADAHPEKLFIAFSTPPLTPLETNAADAKRARRFANWLKSAAYLSGHPNLISFDFFSLLAETDRGSGERNRLRRRYRPDDPHDSHPNAKANAAIGPVLAQFIDNAAAVYQGSCGAPPIRPTPSSPPGGSVFYGRRATLDWDDVPCAVFYEVQVRRDGPKGPLAVGQIAAASRFRTPRLAAGHAYFWRVAARNGEGKSAWTSYRNFSLAP